MEYYKERVANFMENRDKQISGKLATRADYKFNDIKKCFAEPKAFKRIFDS